VKNLALFALVLALFIPAGGQESATQEKSNIHFIPDPVVVDVEEPCDEVQDSTKKRFRLFRRIRRG
jgi:hypothetical protein